MISMVIVRVQIQGAELGLSLGGRNGVMGG